MGNQPNCTQSLNSEMKPVYTGAYGDTKHTVALWSLAFCAQWVDSFLTLKLAVSLERAVARTLAASSQDRWLEQMACN